VGCGQCRAVRVDCGNGPASGGGGINPRVRIFFMICHPRRERNLVMVLVRV
jgi:hypothetical protein